MRSILKIAVCCFLVIFSSCNKSKTDSIMDSLTEFTFINQNNFDDPIVGKYYVEFLGLGTEEPFNLLINKPESEFGQLYSMDFKKTGKIVFEDLTEVYMCGNGILILDKVAWKPTDNGQYELTFDGKYNLEYDFHLVNVYESKKTDTGDIEMKFVKAIERDFRDMNGNRIEKDS